MLVYAQLACFTDFILTCRFFPGLVWGFDCKLLYAVILQVHSCLGVYNSAVLVSSLCVGMGNVVWMVNCKVCCKLVVLFY